MKSIVKNLKNNLENHDCEIINSAYKANYEEESTWYLVRDKKTNIYFYIYLTKDNDAVDDLEFTEDPEDDEDSTDDEIWFDEDIPTYRITYPLSIGNHQTNHRLIEILSLLDKYIIDKDDNND